MNYCYMVKATDQGYKRPFQSRLLPCHRRSMGGCALKKHISRDSTEHESCDQIPSHGWRGMGDKNSSFIALNSGSPFGFGHWTMIMMTRRLQSRRRRSCTSRSTFGKSSWSWSKEKEARGAAVADEIHSINNYFLRFNGDC